MNKSCKNCNQSFEIFPEDREMYGRFEVPEPTWCPECRMIRRMTFRNDRALYKRKCDKCGADKIFMYPADAPFPVYCYECWWSDSWDPKSYGRDYDFSKPFFDQFLELRNAVPRCGVVRQGFSTNSEYTNRVTDMKNCYLVFESTKAEDCRYGIGYDFSQNCMDCFTAQKSERCYECIDVLSCSNLLYSQECQECANSSYLLNCRNCTDCYGCVNLRNKSYCVLNVQYTKEEYKEKIKEFTIEKFEELKRSLPVPALVTRQSTNVTGNWIDNSKNIFQSYNVLEVEDARYCFRVFYGKDLMDFGPWSNKSERMYEGINVGLQCADGKFLNECWSQLINAEYCFNCHSSTNLFGCDGIRKSEYCILNKQYSKEDYEETVKKIKAHMGADYGEYFPMSLSPHAYNETIAQEFFPLTKEQALAKGYRWRDMEEKNPTIGGDVVACEHAGNCNQQCTKAFKMIPDELEFYKQFNLPIPKLCPNCRHFERLAKRNPLKLWDRSCAKCSKEISTSYSPDRPEIVYCIECYQQEVA
ncbi:MAG: hypothetical protein AAB420_04120 [Patescibacteria group bacterium]